MNAYKQIKTNFFNVLLWWVMGIVIISVMLISPVNAGLITTSDIALAKRIIRENTRSIPGFGIGSRVEISSGKFSSSDALVLYMLKFHQQTKVCPPIAMVAEALKKLNDSKVHRKAVAIFWKEYSTSSDINNRLLSSNFLKNNFEWYIFTKQAERLKISNRRLKGFIGSDVAWRSAMDAQRKFWQKSRTRKDEFILNRDSYRVILNAQAAVAAAERAAVSGY